MRAALCCTFCDVIINYSALINSNQHMNFLRKHYMCQKLVEKKNSFFLTEI